MIDFRLADDAEAFRAEVRAFLAEHVTDDVRARVHETGTVHDWDFYRALAQRGWIAAGWPREYGGRDQDPWHARVFYEECALADAPTDGLSMTLMVANTLRLAGTEEQRRRVLPQVLAGDTIICLGYSEPEAGSDVANARLSAMRDGDGWVLNGEKVFTSLAHEAQYVAGDHGGGHAHPGRAGSDEPHQVPRRVGIGHRASGRGRPRVGRPHRRVDI
jgi:alkylation response protein AidB-like acyl-CoA dehydrogenase